MGSKSQHSKATKSKKHGKTPPSGAGADKSTQASTSTGTTYGAVSTPGSVGTVYGGLILDLILDLVLKEPLILPRDLLNLQRVCRSYRDTVDAKLFQHVRIVMKDKKLCIVSASGEKLPGRYPISEASAMSHEGAVAVTVAHLRHTTVADLEAVPVPVGALAILGPHLSQAHTIRLLSDTFGLHTYTPSHTKAQTMIVFPPIIRHLGGGTAPPRKVPHSITKLVQYLACVVDGPGRPRAYWSPGISDGGRGPVLFNTPGPNVTKEVWIFTNYDLTIWPNGIGWNSDAAFDLDNECRHYLMDTTVGRLNTGTIDLTLVDGDHDLLNIIHAYHGILGLCREKHRDPDFADK